MLKLVKTAWAINPSLAINLASRYHSHSIQTEVRDLLVKFPDRAINEPEALPILLAGSLPNDVSSQLKVYIQLILRGFS
jgi:phosphatidylinositol 4-kinase